MQSLTFWTFLVNCDWVAGSLHFLLSSIKQHTRSMFAITRTFALRVLLQTADSYAGPEKRNEPDGPPGNRGKQRRTHRTRAKARKRRPARAKQTWRGVLPAPTCSAIAVLANRTETRTVQHATARTTSTQTAAHPAQVTHTCKMNFGNKQRKCWEKSVDSFKQKKN
jgi:hypothetical protein